MTDDEIVADIDAKIEGWRKEVANLENGFPISHSPKLANPLNAETQAQIERCKALIAMGEKNRTKYAH